VQRKKIDSDFNFNFFNLRFRLKFRRNFFHSSGLSLFFHRSRGGQYFLHFS
jgi:hypothetical protein